MRTAVPADGEAVGASLAACGTVRFYEDDHGRIVRRSVEAVEGNGFGALLALLERRGVDAVLCAAPTEAEARALAGAGLLLAAGASGRADDAVRAYLDRTVARDPNNTCDACGFRNECGVKTE